MLHLNWQHYLQIAAYSNRSGHDYLFDIKILASIVNCRCKVYVKLSKIYGALGFEAVVIIFVSIINMHFSWMLSLKSSRNCLTTMHNYLLVTSCVIYGCLSVYVLFNFYALTFGVACSLFVWMVADGWCWFVLREKYCWLVAGG
jgi:hypothetical protein